MPILDYEDKIQGYISFDMIIVQTAYEFSEFSIPDNKTDLPSNNYENKNNKQFGQYGGFEQQTGGNEL